MKKPLSTWALWKRAEEGIAYLEFALTLPFLLALFMGAVEVTRYVLVVQKVEKVSVSLSDIVAQSQNVTTAQLDSIITATGEILKPYTYGSNTYAIITSVKKTGTNPPKVNWQYTGGGTWTHVSAIGTPGQNATLPSGFTMADKDNVIFAEVFYQFNPLMGYSSLINTTIYRVSIFKPRLGDLSVLGMVLCTERSVV